MLAKGMLIWAIQQVVIKDYVKLNKEPKEHKRFSYMSLKMNVKATNICRLRCCYNKHQNAILCGRDTVMKLLTTSMANR